MAGSIWSLNINKEGFIILNLGGIRLVFFSYKKLSIYIINSELVITSMKRIVFIFLHIFLSCPRVLNVEADQSKCELKDLLEHDSFFFFNDADSASLSFRIFGECFQIIFKLNYIQHPPFQLYCIQVHKQ